MKTIRVNGVTITVNGDADVNVDRFGNITVNVRPNVVYLDRPVWPQQVYFPNKPIFPQKHWLK